ncbi:hypothetical protein [Streptomyces cacaoi]|uniref:hypothetical protein n=1 Tax=Streptomyces cacaoi TaxID=1898 RepID=UPI002628A88B|nr:hypothetical protein [Streptomyces cacaoi]
MNEPIRQTADGGRTAGTKSKLPAYVADELLERLRNTVVGLQRSPEVKTPPPSLSAFVATAIETAVKEAEEEHNSGRPFPPRPHRRLKTGPPIT